MINESLKYLENGWFLVGLKPQGKLPISAATTYKNATNDKTALLNWFETTPKMNVGIQPALSGLLVLDIDTKSGGMEALAQLEKTHGKIQTRSVTTGSGGLHFYFLAPTESLSNHIGVLPGIDIIYSVNHVVAPPSVHSSGGLYRWNDESVPLLPTPSWLVDMLTPKKAIVSTRATSPASNVKGELSQQTKDFLANGAEQGTWNKRLFKAAKDFQEQNYSQEEFIEQAENITGMLDYKDISTINSAFKDEPRYAPRIDSNQVIIDTILKCHLIIDMSDINNRIFVDLESGKSYPAVSHENIPLLLSKDDRTIYMKTRVLHAQVEYNPRLTRLLSTDNDTGFSIYNTYVPPEWLKPSFYQGKQLDTNSKLPELYDKFLSHFTGNDLESKEYVLDWVANSLRSRNFTILTAIGEEGIGKGIFGAILELLHGKSNFSSSSDNVFKERFNGKLQNKTLVYIDEIALKEKESHDRIKAVVNDSLEIEKKGVDSVTAKNYASFYISSNNLDAINIGLNDRRYSIIQLTDEKLNKTDWVKRIDNELLDMGNINQLAHFLFNRKIERNMLIPFRSARFEQIRSATLNTWQEYVIDVFVPQYRGKTVSLSFLQEEIRKGLGGFTSPPGRLKIETLSSKYPDYFKVIQKTGKRMVEIYDIKS